jgi:pimeloyl-ACP methyl ester carboxylesterase
LYLATTKPVCGLILDSPFTTAREMAAVHYGFLPPFLVRLSMDNRSRAEHLTVPLLVFHGTADRIAPIAMGEEIARVGKGELVKLEGAGHNDHVAEGMYRDRMWRFLAGLSPVSSP